jgi:hypothetical protein
VFKKRLIYILSGILQPWLASRLQYIPIGVYKSQNLNSKILNISVHGAESDVIRVFDDKLRLTDEEMQGYLKQADLERYGFKKTVENGKTTDENGKTTTKKTIYYMVTDDCSKITFWEGILEQRLPKKLMNSQIFSTTVKEVESRISGRKTKSCTVGLEIHPGRCSKKALDNGVSKRTASKGCWVCIGCSSATIVYDD